MSGLPYRPGQLSSEFYICGIASLAILILMIIIIVIVNGWRRVLPSLPRAPNSVAAVLTYVVHSNMCASFEGLDKMSIGQRDKYIRGLGKRYGYGLMKVGEEEKWAIDEVGEAGEAGSAHCGSTDELNVPESGLEVVVTPPPNSPTEVK